MLKQMIRQWLMNEDDAATAKRLCTVEERTLNALIAIQSIEKSLKETPQEKHEGFANILYSVWSSTDADRTLADKVKYLEKDTRALRDEFCLLTEHLKIRKMVSSERTYFVPVKRKK